MSLAPYFSDYREYFLLIIGHSPGKTKHQKAKGKRQKVKRKDTGAVLFIREIEI